MTAPAPIRPLAGIRVIEVASWAYVPSAGAVLADWGADVVKVEPPAGDPVRGLSSAGVGSAGGVVPMWEAFNRGKRSMVVDLGHALGRTVVEELVTDADVFLTNLLPGTRRRFGIDEAPIRAINPRIVYGCGTGQGTEGPEAAKGGFDSITFWARGGICDAVTPAGSEPVGLPSGAFGDALSGMALAGGIAGALVRRATTGEGCAVDASLLGTAMWSMQLAITAAAAAGIDELPPMSRANTRNPLVNTYETADGRWIALCMLQSDKYWSPFCEAIGRHDLAHDPDYATQGERAAHVSSAVAALEATFRTRTLEEWIPTLAEQPGQWDVVRRPSETLIDRQARENGFHQWIRYPHGTELPLIANPIQYDGVPPMLTRAPEYGEHTEEILLELGWDHPQILDAKVQGAVI